MESIKTKRALSAHQALLLEMLKDFDAACRKHAIRYQLFAGTALGAVRHKGFIPWDDDMDIVMSRENYEKFRAAFPKFEGYRIEREIWVPRIRRGDGRFSIDVFLFDNVPKNSFKRKYKVFRLKLLQGMMKKKPDLKKYGFGIIEPASGLLACQDVGSGKLPEPEEILQYILRQLAFPHDLAGKKVLVTAGPTQEAIDPVRYLTNHSTGKMGYAIARMAMLRGADVTLVSGPTAIAPPPFVTVVPVVSAQDMFEAVAANAPESDFIFKAAAVADYTPANYSDNKVKKSEGDMSIPLKRTQDILKYLGEHKKSGQFLCGFSMETQNMLENSRAKLEKKKIDMIAANNLKEQGAGFNTDTNVITLITKDEEKQLPKMTKEEVADALLDFIVSKN